MPLPAGVACFAIAGTTATTGDVAIPGDGIVPVDSALGRHATEDRALAFSELLAKAEVYDVLRRWL